MIHNYNGPFVEQILETHYGLKGSLTQMGGYTDKNFMLKVQKEGIIQKFPIKISSNLQKRCLIQLQNYVLKQLQKHQFERQCSFPRIIPTLKNEDMIVVEGQGQVNFIRVLSYVQGGQFCQVMDAPQDLFDEAGRITAHLSFFLQKLSKSKQVDSQVIKQSQSHLCNISNLDCHFNKYFQYLDIKIQTIISNIKNEFHQILPILTTIPKQILHNDICLTNLMIATNQHQQYYISGLIDFSDMIYSYRTSQLVILCARINIDPQHPLKNILRIANAYNKVRELTKQQKQIFFPMIKARLALLCLVSSFLTQQRDDEYLVKCKMSQISHLQTLNNYCSNEEFLQHLQNALSQSQ